MSHEPGTLLHTTAWVCLRIGHPKIWWFIIIFPTENCIWWHPLWLLRQHCLWQKNGASRLWTSHCSGSSGHLVLHWIQSRKDGGERIERMKHEGRIQPQICTQGLIQMYVIHIYNNNSNNNNNYYSYTWYVYMCVIYSATSCGCLRTKKKTDCFPSWAWTATGRYHSLKHSIGIIQFRSLEHSEHWNHQPKNTYTGIEHCNFEAWSDFETPM